VREDPIVDLRYGLDDSITADCNCPASPTVVVAVYGEIDILTERQFARHLQHHLRPQSEVAEVTVDLTAMTFIGARGISTLAEAADLALRLNIAFTLVGCSPWTSRVIAMWQSLNPEPLELGRDRNNNAAFGKRARQRSRGGPARAGEPV
jgi:anti-anti-sigma factor